MSNMAFVEPWPLVPFLPDAPAPALARGSRRIATRRAVVVPCQAVRLRDFKLIADRTLDVSVDGLYVPLSTSLTVLTGETLIVSFPIPGAWIDAEATVSRVVHGRRPGDEGPAIGVVFDSMTPSSRAALAGFLHGRPPPLPRRGPLGRLRRGGDPPQLADASIMSFSLARPPCVQPPSPLPDPVIELEGDDVEEIVDDESEIDEALGILREVAEAWKKIVQTVAAG